MFEMQVYMFEAQSSLSKFPEKAWEGEEIVITRAGEPYLDLVPHLPRSKPRLLSALKAAI